VSKPKPEIEALIRLREATEEDLPFVLDSWRNAAYKHLESSLWLSKHAKKPTMIIWNQLFPMIQRLILQRAKVFVVCSAEASTQILSFAVIERLPDGMPILHWVSTKKAMWRNGLAEFLLTAAGFDSANPAVFTFSGSAYNHVKSRLAKWDYVPFWLFIFNSKDQNARP
jgi:hypothetical protein